MAAPLCAFAVAVHSAWRDLARLRLLPSLPLLHGITVTWTATARSASWYRLSRLCVCRVVLSNRLHTCFCSPLVCPLIRYDSGRSGNIHANSRVCAPQGSSVLPALVATGVSIATQKFANGGLCCSMRMFFAIMMPALAFWLLRGSGAGVVP